MAAETKASVTKWLNVISLYDREFKKWESRVDKIIKRYRDEGRAGRNESGAKFNILWANVQTALPATFSRLPQPDVSRRHKDTDPVGRIAALLLERGLEFEVSHYPDYRLSMSSCVLDRFLGGRGTTWVRYEPHFSNGPNPPPPEADPNGPDDDGTQITEDADEAPGQEVIEFEQAPSDYVHWKDFGHTVARTWEEVTAVWRRVYLGRNALVERFGEELGGKIPLDTKPDDSKRATAGEGELEYQALIHEIWDKESGTAIWLSKSMGKILDEKPDPLGLENFWPCPKPLFATLTNESLVPVPDFALYQDQADTLDTIADRIDGLVKALQVKGVHNAAIPELARIFTEAGNTDLIPVKNWAAFAEKQGLKGAIDLVDLTPIFNALKACYEAAEQQKNMVFELMGLADIMRGSSDPRETAAAQEMKGNFGSMRLRAMQADVAHFATEILQIKAQIICRQFTAETIGKIGGADTLSDTDKALVPQALALLKNSTLRDFRIEIVADSMIYMDEQQERQDRMEMLNAMGNFLKEAVPAATDNPPLAPLLMAMMRFGATSFKVGKQIEGEFDSVADMLTQQAKQPQQPKPDPEMAKIQAESQARSQELQQKAQMDQQALQAKIQYDQQKAQLDAQLAQAQQAAQAQQEQQQEQLEAQRAQQEAHLKAQVDQNKANLDAHIKALELSFDKYKADLDAKVKIAVAEIAAKATLQASQQKASFDEVTGAPVKDKPVGASAEPPQAPPIHIHMPSGNKKITKNPDGSYQSTDA